MIVPSGVEEGAAAGLTEEVFGVEFKRAEAAADPSPEDFLDEGVVLILMSSGLLPYVYASIPSRCLID